MFDRYWDELTVEDKVWLPDMRLEAVVEEKGESLRPYIVKTPTSLFWRNNGFLHLLPSDNPERSITLSDNLNNEGLDNDCEQANENDCLIRDAE